MPDEIPLIPKEEVIIPEKTYKTGKWSDKMIMLHRRTTMHTEDIKSIKKRIENAQKLVQPSFQLKLVTTYTQSCRYRCKEE